ncbi:MAG TPA: hypothetical protein VKY37_05140 [Brumimicrobium sp.]|nr:hypothetical protein [Brumimicrobium sp.]
MYFQVLAFGLILVFSPCSVRNSIQDSLGLEKTGVSNKSKTTNNFEDLCSVLSIDVDGDQSSEIINTTPELPSYGIATVYNSHKNWSINNKVSENQYEAPYTVKDKTPLYLLHQQFKVYLQEA